MTKNKKAGLKKRRKIIKLKKDALMYQKKSKKKTSYLKSIVA